MEAPVDRTVGVAPPPVVTGTPAERNANTTAMQQEAAWVASRVEGTRQRHKGLLISAMTRRRFHTVLLQKEK